MSACWDSEGAEATAILWPCLTTRHEQQLSCVIPDGPIRTIFRGRLTNDELENGICLKNATCAETTSMTFGLIDVTAQVSLLKPNDSLLLTIR